MSRPTVVHLGWGLFWLGFVMDAAYHLPVWFFAVQWPPTIDAIGEFGHTVIFVGIVTLIFALLRKNAK